MKTKILIIAALMACSTMANAIIVTVQDNIADNTFIATPDSISGEFDINSALANDGSFVNPFDITSATATYSFLDDGDLSSENTVYTSYTRGNGRRYYRNKISYFFDAYESVQVTTSLQQSSDGTSFFNTGDDFTGQIYEGRSACWACAYNYYYTRTYDNERGYTGQFVMEQQFNTNSLNDLATDGVVGFTVAATSGDIIFGSASLTLDINANPVEATGPSTVGLFGFGLISLVFFRRKLIARFNKFS